MSKSIKRLIKSTTINGFFVEVKDGIPEVVNLDPVTAYGEVSKAQAVKALATAYPDIKGVGVAKIETTENLYEISVEAFVAHANIIEKENK